MSRPFGLVALTMGDITRLIRGTFDTVVDARKGKSKSYTLVDAGLSAFSVFFMQSPSFLEYQSTLEQAHGENNARTLFGVHEIPSDCRFASGCSPPRLAATQLPSASEVMAHCH